MNKIFKFKFILMITVGLIVCSCYEDKGNYGYKELTSLSIDTTNSVVKAEMTAIQLENFKLPVNIKYAGDKADLSFEWKIYPQNPQKPEDVSMYDSAKVISQQEVLDTVIYEVPGKYYLTYTVTNRENDTREFLTIKLNVESALSRGLCILDENNGLYDLNMIKSAKLLTDLSPDDEKVYYQLFTKVNDERITDAKFIGQYQTTLYLFTTSGAYCLNSNTFEVTKSDYKYLFDFPNAITPAPQAYTVIPGRPMEMLINNGFVHIFNRDPYQGKTGFGDRLNGDYLAAPYLISMGTQTFSTVIYDTKNGRFAPIDQFGSNVGEFEDNNEAEFNLNNIGKDMEIQCMDNGFNDYTYAVFKNKVTSAYSLYIADFSTETAMPVKKYDMSGCTGLNDQCLYAFGNRGNVCFYASGSDLYQYKYASVNTGNSVHTFNGETISNIQIFKKSGHIWDGKLLIVSTYNSAGEGKVYMIEFNELNGSLGTVTDKPYTGFGQIVDVFYKE